MSEERRVNVVVSEAAYERLLAEARRQQIKEGRGKQYAFWRIIDALLMTLPDPDTVRNGEPSWR